MTRHARPGVAGIDSNGSLMRAMLRQQLCTYMHYMYVCSVGNSEPGWRRPVRKTTVRALVNCSNGLMGLALALTPSDVAVLATARLLASAPMFS